MKNLVFTGKKLKLVNFLSSWNKLESFLTVWVGISLLL